MKKTVSIIISAILLIALVSCASTGSGGAASQAPTGPQTVHVKTIEELAKATKTKEVTVIVDNDLVWNPQYTGESPLEVSCTKGAVIDLNGHTISGVKSCGFRIFGDFTIKNGTIVGEGDSYGLLINSNNTTSGVNYNPDTRDNSKVTVENLKLVECGIRAELSTIKVINCDVQNSGESGQSNCLYFVGVWATVEGGKLNQTATPIDTISRTNCVYCSGTSTVTVTGVVLEGNKRMNAYKNTVAYIVSGCEGANTTTPEVVTIK